jgi:hypothetical protein
VSTAEGWLYDDAAARWTRLPRPEDAPEEPGSAAWVGELLIVVGGSQWDDSDQLGDVSVEDVYSTRVWGHQVTG